MTLVRSRRMSAPWSRALRALALVVPATGVGACSLVNSFGDVRTSPADASTDTTEPGDSGGMESGRGDSGGKDGGSEGGFDSGFPDKGVVVISGRVSDDAGDLTGVLTAIDPTDGHELPNARQMLNVPVAQYDGLRDLWIIIETDGQSLFPTPNDKATLHIRTLDPTTGDWVTLGSLSVPPPVFGLSTVVKNRLVYIGYDSLVDAASGTSFVTIDTSDPTNPNIYASLGLAVQPQGIIGTRTNSAPAGGPVNMLESVPCGVLHKMAGVDVGDAADEGADEAGDEAGAIDAGGVDGGGIGGGLCLALQHVTVPTNSDLPTLGTASPLGPFFGRPGYGSYLGAPGTSSPVDVIGWAVPGSNPGAPGQTSINTYSPFNNAPQGQAISFQTSDGFFQPFAFSECEQQLLLTGTNEDLSIYAIPFSSPAGTTRITTSHSGQSLAYEPYTHTVLSPFTQGDGYVLDAFTLSLNNGSMSSPQLTQRTGTSTWNPPADVRPELLAVRKPLPVKCPP